MKNIEKLVIYTTTDGDKKAHVFYTDGSERKIRMDDNQPAEQNEAYQIMRKTIIDNNMSMSDFKKYINSPNSRFIVGKTIRPEEENDYLNSFRKNKIDGFERKNICGYDVDVNKVAFPTTGPAQLTEEDFEDDYDDDYVEKKEDGKVKSFLKSVANKFKKSRLGVKVTAVALAGAMLFGLYSCTHKKSLDGQIAKNNIDYIQTQSVDNENTTQESNNDGVISVSAVPVATTEYEKLLAKSTSLKQREVMQMMSDNLDYYNISFANSHREEGKNIKTCITWDEMMALQISVNDYTDEELRDIFPQLRVDSNFVSNTIKNYNKANLQLMMSYIIETKDSRVNAYKIVESSEGQEFVKKYEDMYFAAHEATGTQKLELVKKFYDSVRKDFNLDKSTNYKQYPSYYQLVSNIISAGEMEFQNLEIDYTLTDEEIIRFQSIELCEIAHNKIENHLYKIIESTQTYCYGSKDGGSKDGNDSTIYNQFREEKIKELEEKDSYFKNEDSRDISKYDEFIKRVNKEVECFTYYKEGSGIKSEEECKTEIYTKNEIETSSRTETDTSYNTVTTVTKTNDRDEAIKKSSKEQVEKAEAEVDCQVEKENEERKIQAEKEAEENRKKLQQEADEQAKKNEEEVKKDREDLQNKIDEANNKINNGGIVNENELGHDVKFDEEHSDENGNLDNSVKDITTDGTGANNPLPDPNKTGAEFDNKAQVTDNKQGDSTSSNTSSSSGTTNSEEGFYTEEITSSTKKSENSSNASNSTNVSSTETTNITSGKQTIIEYEEPINAPLTNEQLVDAYINSLEQTSVDESSKILSK